MLGLKPIYKFIRTEEKEYSLDSRTIRSELNMPLRKIYKSSNKFLFPLNVFTVNRGVILYLYRPQRNPQREDHIDFKICTAAKSIRVSQSPLAASVFLRDTQQRKSFVAADRRDCLFNLLPFSKHHVAVRGPYIVQIDING